MGLCRTVMGFPSNRLRSAYEVAFVRVFGRLPQQAAGFGTAGCDNCRRA